MNPAGAHDNRSGRRPNRRTVAGVLAVAVAVAGVVVATRNDGYPGRSVRVFAGTRWLVDSEEGTVLLADALSGRATLRIATDRKGNELGTVQSDATAFLLDLTKGEAVSIDQKGVKLSDARAVPGLKGAQNWHFGAGADGAVAASSGGTGADIPTRGTPTPLTFTSSITDPAISDDGAVWTLGEDQLVHRSLGGTNEAMSVANRPTDSAIGAVGTQGVLLDRGNRRVDWLTERTSVELPLTLDLRDGVLQQPGADAPCVWVGAGGQLACVGPSSVVSTVRLDSFTFQRDDKLLVADGVAAVVRGESVVWIELANGQVKPVEGYSWRKPARLSLSSDEVAIWIDDPAGPSAIAITAAGARTIDKRDETTPNFGPDGTSLPIAEAASVDTSPEPNGSLVPGSGQLPKPDDNGIDDPPVANPDFVTSKQDTPVPIGVTANDYDPDGGPVVVIDAGKAAHGTTQVLSSTSVVYQPNPDFVGVDTFGYTISDSTDHLATSTVTVEVVSRDAQNRPPVASPDSADTIAGRAVDIDVLANDLDPEAGPLSIDAVSQPTSDAGRVDLVDGRTGHAALHFTPADGFSGDASFTYRAVDDQRAESADTVVQVHVAAPGRENRKPVAGPDSAQVTAGSKVTIPVLANDTDPDNDPLAITSAVVDSRQATATIDRGQIVFSAAASASGQVAFDYTISDPGGLTAQGQVLVRILPAGERDRAPVARPDQFTAGPGLNRFSPLANDEDPDGDPLVITDVAVQGAAAAVVDHTETELWVTPAAGATGTVKIVYTINDGHGLTANAVATVVLTDVTADSAPVMGPASFDVEAGETKQLEVLARELSGGPLTLVATSPCPPATCTVTGDTITFTAPEIVPPTPVSFSYTVKNASGRTAIGQVSVLVHPATAVNRSPVAANYTISMTPGSDALIKATDLASDPDGDPLTVTSTTTDPRDTRNGVRVSIEPDGVRVVVPADFTDSLISFGYTVTDPGGSFASGRVIVAVQAPRASKPIVPDVAKVLEAGSSLTFDLVAGAVDPDNANDSLRLAGAPQLIPGSDIGSLTQVDGRQVKVTAKAGVEGTMRFRFDVVDPTGNTGSGTLTVEVDLPSNDPPVAGDDAASTSGTTPVTIQVLDNDRDPDVGDSITAVLRTQPDSRDATVQSTQNGRAFVVTPVAGGSSPITFTYVARDQLGHTSAPATVTVSVLACADSLPPTPDLPGLFTPYDTPLLISLIPGLTPPPQLSFDQETGGSVSGGLTPGTAVFTPTAGNNGGGGFRYTVTNACGRSATGLVVIDVNRAPVMIPRSFDVVRGATLSTSVTSFAADEEALTIVSATSDSGPAGSPDGTTLQFTPSIASGTAFIAVVVADPGGLQASGTISVRVTDPTNQPPTAANDTVMIPPGASTPIDVLANDDDPDGSHDGLRVADVDSSVTVGGQSVQLSVSSDGRSVVATVPPGTHGTAAFTYRATDPSGDLSNSATVSLSVNALPSPVDLEFSMNAGDTLIQDMYPPGVPGDPDGEPVVHDVSSTTDSRVVVDFLPGLRIKIVVGPDVPTGDVRVSFTIYDTSQGRGNGHLLVHVTGAGPAPTGPGATG